MTDVPGHLPGFVQLANTVLNLIGAVGVVTMVVYMVRLATAWGRMVTLVETGFETNERKFDKVEETIGHHSQQLGHLQRSVGRLEGRQ